MGDRKNGKRIRVALVAVAAVLSGSSVMAGMMLAPGDDAPKLRAATLSNDVVTVRWDEHRLTVVNFWATWCIPCRDEMPRLQELQNRRGGDGLRVLGVAVGAEGAEQIASFLKRAEIEYENLLVDKNTTGLWKATGILPTTYLIDQEGKIVQRHAGATEEQVELLVAMVEAYLDGKPLDLESLKSALDAEPVGDDTRSE